MTKKKLVNLQKALKECGVDTDLTLIDGDLILSGTFWNCINGNEEPFGFFTEGDEISHYVEPKTDNDYLMAQLKAM